MSKYYKTGNLKKDEAEYNRVYVFHWYQTITYKQAFLQLYVFHRTLDWSKKSQFNFLIRIKMKITSTDDPDGHVGLGKVHLSLILVLLLTFLVVINLVLTHIYSSWTPFVPTVPEREEMLG